MGRVVVLQDLVSISEAVKHWRQHHTTAPSKVAAT
jgi:hypothetical protein